MTPILVRLSCAIAAGALASVAAAAPVAAAAAPAPVAFIAHGLVLGAAVYLVAAGDGAAEQPARAGLTLSGAPSAARPRLRKIWIASHLNTRSHSKFGKDHPWTKQLF